MELIPGTDLNPEKKGFTWKLIQFNEEFLDFVLKFDYPEVISMIKPDSIKVIFDNTDYYLKAVEINK